MEVPIEVSDGIDVRTPVDIRVPDTQVSTPLVVVPARDVVADRIELDRSTVVPGGAATATVTLTAPAPPDGAEVRIESGDESLLKAPSTVTVPAGETAVSFPVEVARTIAEPTTVDLRGEFRTPVSTPILATPILSRSTLGSIR